MANKWAGIIGYHTTTEVAPSVHIEDITEAAYTGDIIQHTARREQGANINADSLSTITISIVADPMAMTNFMHMAYITYMGAKWSVSSTVVDYPRIQIALGGLYHADKRGV